MPRKSKSAASESSGVATLLPPEGVPALPFGGSASSDPTDLLTRVDTHREQDILALREAQAEATKVIEIGYATRRKVLDRLKLLGVEVEEDESDKAVASLRIPAVRVPSKADNGKKLSLGSVMIAAFQQAGGPLSVPDLVTAVQALGYESKSKSFRGIVNQTLIKLKKTFRNVSRGVYDLKGRDKAPLVAKTASNGRGKSEIAGLQGLQPGSATTKILHVIQKLGTNVSAADIRAEMRASHPDVKDGAFQSAIVQLRGPMKKGKQLEKDSRILASGEGRNVRYSLNV